MATDNNPRSLARALRVASQTEPNPYEARALARHADRLEFIFPRSIVRTLIQGLMA